MDGSPDPPRPTYIDPSLARGLVRHEARQLREAHEQIRHIPDELYRGIVDRFKGRRRLSASNLKLLAGEIDRKASSALSSICSSMTQRTPSRFRPGSVRYDIVHYVVGAVEQPAVAGRTPMDRIMRLCVFAARLDQREVAMSFRELPLCFWEHAAPYEIAAGNMTRRCARSRGDWRQPISCRPWPCARPGGRLTDRRSPYRSPAACYSVASRPSRRSTIQAAM